MKSLLLEEVKTVIKLGVKSQFGDMDLLQGSPLWTYFLFFSSINSQI